MSLAILHNFVEPVIHSAIEGVRISYSASRHVHDVLEDSPAPKISDFHRTVAGSLSRDLSQIG